MRHNFLTTKKYRNRKALICYILSFFLYIVNVTFSDDPDSKITANGRVLLGQLADVHADAYKNGAKKNLFHASIHLDDEKFLKPDFGYDKDNIVYAMVSIHHSRARYTMFI